MPWWWCGLRAAWALVAKGCDALAAAIDDEPGDIGASVVAGDVEVLAFTSDAGVVELGDDEGFAVDDRFDEEGTVGSGDGGAAVGEEGCTVGEDLVAGEGAGGQVLGAHEAGDGDDVAAGLAGDEAGEVAGVVEAAGPDGDVEVLALGVESGAREGHPVLVAVEAAYLEGAEVVHAEAVSIALCPGEALLIGGVEFAMNGADVAGAIDVDEAAIEAVAAAVGGAFHDAEVDGQAVGCREVAEGTKIAALDVDALIEVAGEDLFLFGVVEARAVGAFDPERVAGDEGFAEGDEVAALGGGEFEGGGYLFEGCRAMEPDGGDLGATDGEQVLIGDAGCGCVDDLHGLPFGTKCNGLCVLKAGLRGVNPAAASHVGS